MSSVATHSTHASAHSLTPCTAGAACCFQVDLYYTLSFQCDDPNRSPPLESMVSCDLVQGLVPARNTVNVRLTLTPDRREFLRFSIYCALRPGAQGGLGRAETADGQPSSQLGPPLKVCDVTAEADYPLLQSNGRAARTLADRGPRPTHSTPSPPRPLSSPPPCHACKGSPPAFRTHAAVSAPEAPQPAHLTRCIPPRAVVDARMQGFPQAEVWRQLKLADINDELAAVLSDAESRMNSAQGLSSAGDVASMQRDLESIDVSLPPALPNSADCELHLLIKNTGDLAASFRVRYPTEMELQIEHWADKGEPSAVELKQHLTVDKKILSVLPKKAALEPGECVRVTLRMRHFRADEYELPLLFQIESGKQLVLNVLGRTLAVGEIYLHLPTRLIHFGASPIGMSQPQLHTIDLPNFSDLPIDYEVGLVEIDDLNAANFGFRVLQCVQPVGTIAPFATAHVPFLFHPLEPREYKVAIKVAVRGAGTRTLLIVASGYHPSAGLQAEEEDAARLTKLAPPLQLLQLPAQQPLRLGADRALFGRVPLTATSR